MNSFRLLLLLLVTLIATNPLLAQPINDGGDGRRKSEEVGDAVQKNAVPPITDPGNGQRAKPLAGPTAASVTMSNNKKKPPRSSGK